MEKIEDGKDFMVRRPQPDVPVLFRAYPGPVTVTACLHATRGYAVNMKPCSRCHSVNDGSSHSWCRPCRAAYARATRPKHCDMSPEQRKRANCRAYTGVLLRRGKLTRLPCRACGSPESQAHHEDYGNPRLVDWLCRPCHLHAHNVSRIPSLALCLEPGVRGARRPRSSSFTFS